MNNDLSLLDQLVGDLLSDASFQTITDEDFGTVATTVIPEDLEMLKRVSDFCKNPTVYSVQYFSVSEDGVADDDIVLFLKWDDAVAFFESVVSGIRKDARKQGREGWLEYDGTADDYAFYETSPDGTLDGSHYACYLCSRPIN